MDSDREPVPPDTQLSQHFTYGEFTHTNTGLPNVPTEPMEERLELLAQFMEKVRAILGNNPITVNSAYRSPEVNAAVGGVPNSAHMEAYACDFTCPAFGSPYEVCVALSEAQKMGDIAFDQLIYEINNAVVHISRDQRLREERLTELRNDVYADGIIDA